MLRILNQYSQIPGQSNPFHAMRIDLHQSHTQVFNLNINLNQQGTYSKETISHSTDSLVVLLLFVETRT